MEKRENCKEKREGRVANYQEKGENVGKLQKEEKVGGQIVKRREGGVTNCKEKGGKWGNYEEKEGRW